LDALERDLKREKEGMATTTEIIGEPARSFRLVAVLGWVEQARG
jgi:transcription factor STE12